MTPEEERWAEAGQLLKLKGDNAAAFVAERIAALRIVGEAAGVRRFEAIGSRLTALIDAAHA